MFRLITTMAVVLGINPTTVAAQEYGQFLDRLIGEFVDGEKRPEFVLQKQFSYKDPKDRIWTAVEGYQVDGASIPWFLWSAVGGPFSGYYLKSSVVHDFYVDKKIRTDVATHLSFYYGMRAADVGWTEAKSKYWAVSAYKSWDLGAETGENWCVMVNNSELCEPIREVKNVRTLSVSDLLPGSIFVRKFNAIQSSLATGNGQFLDHLNGQDFDSSLDSIRQNAEQFGELLRKGSAIEDPESLGLLGSPYVGFEQPAQPWVGNEIPKIEQFPNGPQYGLDGLQWDGRTEVPPALLNWNESKAVDFQGKEGQLEDQPFGSTNGLEFDETDNPSGAIDIINPEVPKSLLNRSTNAPLNDN